MQIYWSQVHIQSHILGGKIGIYNRLDLKYMQKIGTCDLLVAGICLALYFEWENRYLQLARPQLHGIL